MTGGHDKLQELTEPVYSGYWSVTRAEKGHIPCQCGIIFKTDIYSSVNTSTDSSCQFAVVEGTLNSAVCPRCGKSYDLAVPVTFHDPENLRFAFFIPDALLHDELKLRIELLENMASRSDELIPVYVRSMLVLSGIYELRLWIDGKIPRYEDADVEKQIAVSDTALREKMDAVRRKEAELGRLREKLMAEKEIVPALKNEINILRRKLAENEAAENSSRPTPDYITMSSSGTSAPSLPSLEDIEEVPLDDIVGSALKDSEDDVSSLSPDELEEVTSISPDEIEEIEETDEIIESTQPDTEELEEIEEIEEIDEQPSEEAAAPLPPADLNESVGSVCMRLDQSRVFLYVRVDPAVYNRMSGDSSDLWCQLHVLDNYPLVCLVLVETIDSSEPEGIWWNFNIINEEDQAILSSLIREFSATIVFFGPLDEYLGTLRRSADREANLSLILKKARNLIRGMDPDSLSIEKAVSEFDSIKDKTGNRRPPFAGTSFMPPDNFLDIGTALDVLIEWMDSDQYEYLILVRSIPVDQWRSIETKILQRALSFGVALPRKLQDKALSIELADDYGDLILKTTDAFMHVIEEDGTIPLEDAARNWQALLQDAEEHDVFLSEPVINQARTTMERAGLLLAEDKPLDDETREKIPEMSREELEALIQRPSARLIAAMELARRGEQASLDTVFNALSRLSPAELIKIMPVAAVFGESSGDYLIDMIKSRRAHIRHVAAMTLGWMKLRRGLVPILSQLLIERTPVWTGIAAAAGLYGKGAVRPLVRYLGEPVDRPERLSMCVAFLAASSDKVASELRKTAEKGNDGVKKLIDQGLMTSLRMQEDPVLAYGEYLIKCLKDISDDTEMDDTESIEEIIDNYTKAIV